MTDEANISPPSSDGPPPIPAAVPTPVPVLPLGYADGLGRVLPPLGKLSFPQQAARASWIAPCIALGLGVVSNSVLNNGHPRGGTVGFQNLIAIFPPGVQPDQIDRMILTRDGNRVAIIGRLLTVEERAANMAQAKAAASPPAP